MGIGKHIIAYSIIALSGYSAFSQDCVVGKESLKGTYTGDCKDGKANGSGKAVGTDTYEGQFKSGLPEGRGTYTWANGDVYTGTFSKGLRSGVGTFTFIKDDGTDSSYIGYWKKGEYRGKYDKPYLIYYTSEAVVDVSVQFRKDVFNQVTFWITNTSGGTPRGNTWANEGSNTDRGSSTTSGGFGSNPRLTVDAITIAPGGYQRMEQNTDHGKKTETILYSVWYPAKMKLNIGPEMIELELLESGSYVINISINR